MLGNLMASSWVYGEEATGTYDISKDEIEKKLEQRYFQDYIYYWQSFIDDLSLNQYIKCSSWFIGNNKFWF